MKLKKITPQKNRAQAMVEFAIALPILLMLLYGILETSRLLFIYSTVVTASRQAVRYGSATGIGANGVPRYQDCAGIRASANRADFLNAFEPDDIHIFYDQGPGTSPTEFCLGGVLTDPSLTSTILADNNHRLVVEIDGDFFPLVPKLVPFIERSVANSHPIEGNSARTILLSISIGVTDTPDLNPSTPTSTATLTSTTTGTATNTSTFTPSPSFTPSPTLQFTFTPSQTPTRTLTPTLTLSPTPSPTPTITNTPTITPSPTLSPTPVACSSTNLKAGPNGITKSGSSMSLVVINNLGTPIQVKDIFVVWNHNYGHDRGDRTLKLISVAWEPPIWNGPTSNGPSITIVPSPTTYVQPGSSTLTFTFNQSYDNWEGHGHQNKDNQTPERILISFLTPGCTSYTIDVSHVP
ncbi:MAG: TadE family protein [Anaerolineales bacterium]